MANIFYILIVPNSNDVTLFQGWNEELVSPEFLSILSAVAVAPFDTGEIFIDQQALLSIRETGMHRSVAVLGAGLIHTIPMLIADKFSIVISLPQYVDEILAQDYGGDCTPIVATTKHMDGAYQIPFDNTKNPVHLFDSAILEQIKKLTSTPSKISQMKIRDEYSLKANCMRRGSGSTLANEIVHHSLGVVFERNAPINPVNIEAFFDAIAQSVNSVLDFTRRSNPAPGEAVIYAPAIQSELYNINAHAWNQTLRKVKNPSLRDFVKNGLIRNPGYSGISATDIQDPREIFQDPITSQILKERQGELALTNASVALLASSETIPAIRLPNSINLHSSKLKDIETAYKRGDRKSALDLQEKFKIFSRSVKCEMGTLLRRLIEQSFDSCKVCSDVPLEWIYLNKLPMMISHEVSKIPMTPGNMLLQQSAMGTIRTINAKDLQDVLVIRSFNNQDKIKSFLEIGINTFPLNNGTVARFVDVSTPDEVFAALNSYRGNIVVFDCHGDHDGAKGSAWLQIGAHRLNSWELFDKARVPPIVMLSACSTAPITGSHVTVANGFIRSGALSVIGTFLPVNAAQSSALISRIIFRIDAFLPAIKAMGFETITWRTFISGFLRMSYTTDVLHFLMDTCKIITSEDYDRIHNDANHRINLMMEDWYDHVLRQVSESSGLGEEEILEKITQNSPLVETMFYCQQGRPELLNILL